MIFFQWTIYAFPPSHISLKSILAFELIQYISFVCVLFFPLVYLSVILIHTCSIIVTMGTKRALQLCKKKKKWEEYFYIVDTWLNNCFLLTSTLHLPHVLILTQGRLCPNTQYLWTLSNYFSCRLMLHFVQYTYMLYSKDILKLQKLF